MTSRTPFRLGKFLTLACLFATVFVSRAQVLIMMQVPGITGESRLQGYLGWSELDSATFSASKASANSPAQCGGIQISKRGDSTSPLLFSRVVQGTIVGELGSKLKIHYLASVGRGEYRPIMEIELEGARIASIAHNSSGEIPSEAISLEVTKMTMVTRVYNDQGTEDGSKRQTVTHSFAP